ncbi:hypothetical protein BH10PSE10_BH10PSE10_26050 [soil metagenome]
MEQPVPDFHADSGDRTAKEKHGLLAEAGLVEPLSLCDQPRVRERIMKLSLVYSATCHHRYSSER